MQNNLPLVIFTNRKYFFNPTKEKYMHLKSFTITLLMVKILVTSIMLKHWTMNLMDK